jgi:proteasome accessory factor B
MQERIPPHLSARASDPPGSNRKEGFNRLLDLIHALTDHPEGLTLDEMATHIGQGRRTAERMRNVIALHFDLIDTADGSKRRFRIHDNWLRHYIAPSATELAALEAEVSALTKKKAARAVALSSLLGKIRASLTSATRTRLDVDIEPLVRLQRTMVGPGPIIPSNAAHLIAVYQAMLEGRCLEFSYQAEQYEEARWRRVIPYGLLHNSLSYLIARRPDQEADTILYYRLDRMQDVRLSEKLGTVPEDFDLDDWIAHSFGIWRDASHDIALRILPHAVQRAKNWHFHPHQRLEPQEDGSAVVRFSASGLPELAHHLFGWAGMVEIIAPDELREILRVSVVRTFGTTRGVN